MKLSETNTHPEKQILSSGEVAGMLGVSRVTFWRLRKQQDFPKGMKISERCLRWQKSHVEDWLAARELV